MKRLSSVEQVWRVKASILLAPPSERLVLGAFFADCKVPVLYWNPELSFYYRWQVSQWHQGELVCNFTDLIDSVSSDTVILVEGMLERENALALANYVYQLKWGNWVFIGETLTTAVPSWLPIWEWGLPTEEEIKKLLRNCGFNPALQLIRASLGLPLGELQQVLEWATTAQDLMAYKQQKLLKLGVSVVSPPDLPTTGGLDRLDATFDRIAALFDDRAAEFNLSVPKGMLLWGLPGTGKSLAAKLAAQKMSVPLISVDWGGLIAQGVGGEVRFRYLLNLAHAIAPCILFLDDFEKAFSTWDSSDGGVGRRLAGKLLTWLQDHQEKIFTLATINRLEMLPSELIRRFDYIYFVDLPTDGARYEVFQLQLSRFFADFSFTDEQWRLLLQEYRAFTPAEIEQAVRRVAIEAFYQGMGGQVSFEALLEARSQFTPASERDVDQLAKIRNRRDLAEPASSRDTTQWRLVEEDLFA